MRIVTTTGDFYEKENNDVSPAQTLEWLSMTDFRFIDCSFCHLEKKELLGGDRWKDMIHETKEAAQKYGMTFVQAHAPMGPVLEKGLDGETFFELTVRSLKGCQLLNIPWTVVHIVHIDGPDNKAHRTKIMNENKRFFEKLYPYMEKYGVGILIENTTDRFVPKKGGVRRFCSTVEEMLETVDFFDHPLIGTCLDTGHAHMQNLNLYDTIIELGDTLKGVHVHDNNGIDDQHILPYQGSIDWSNFIRGLKDIDYQGDLTFEACTSIKQVPHSLKSSVYQLMYDQGKHLCALFEY